jgi:sarcosine oxidase subunit alpha
MQHLEFCHQALWPKLDVRMVSVSEQWAQFSVAGPRPAMFCAAWSIRAHDLSDDAMPYLAARSVTVGGGVPARLFRISFSGELAYELAVPASFGHAAIPGHHGGRHPLRIVPTAPRRSGSCGSRRATWPATS